jgi:putative ABC transport system permease protein
MQPKKWFLNKLKLQTMLTEYIKSTLRSLSRQKGFATLNFLGLGTALTIALLTGLMLVHERHFDDFHPVGDRIYRVVTHIEDPTSGTVNKISSPATILPSYLRDQKLDIGQLTEVNFMDEMVVRLTAERFFLEKSLLYADTAFFSLFNFKTKTGNALAALQRPNQVLLTETTAARYFPKENAIGKRITIEDGECLSKEFEVAGIIEDAPANSHLQFSMLVSALSRKQSTDAGWGWFNSSQLLYVKTGSQMDAAQIGQRLTSIATEHQDKDDKSRYEYKLQPLADIHTNMDYADGNISYTADFQQFYWLGAIALFLLLIAAVNYINLATAIALRKAREVGVRKSLGASRWDLAKRFWFETFVLVAAAVLTAALVANLLLPILNNFLDRKIVVNWFSPEVLGIMAGLCAITTLAAGFYPAIVMAGFSPTEAFRGKISGKGNSTSLLLRKGLVTFQFVVAQVFIIAVIVAAMQMKYIRSKPLGFQSAGIVTLRLPQAGKAANTSTLISEFNKIPGVISMTQGIGAPTSSSGMTTVFNTPEKYEQNGKEVIIKIADPKYLETYGLQLRSGRFLNASDMAAAAESVPEKDRKYSVVLNETGVKNLGFSDPEAAIGQKVQLGMNNMTAPVIGVVADFHTRSLRSDMASVAILPYHNRNYSLGIRLDPSAANMATLAKMESIWKSVFPADLFTAAFLDDYLVSLYRDESRLYSMFKLIALLALLINALGLIGLTVFVVEAKTKEIGIRKVLGASVAGITSLLAKDYLKLVIIAIVFASPVAYYFMQKWLTNFAYRIDIQAWMFVAAGFAAVLIAFLTVGFQSVKAALANPVKSLRSE